MKIGIYIAPSHTVPPEEKKILAPWILAGEIADGLVKTGRHDVYLFAPVGSQSKAILKDFGIQASILQEGKLSANDFLNFLIEDEKRMFMGMIEFAREEGIEIIHVHQTKRMFDLISLAPKSIRFVFTIHNPIDEKFEGEISELSKLGNCFFVSISNSQRKGLDLPFVDTVYNGVNLEEYIFSPVGGERFLTAGRIVPEKGIEDAIEAVKATGSKLLLTGAPYKEKEESRVYWENQIQPQIDGQNITYHDNFLHSELIGVYQNSKALLFPIKWEEPFGLVMVEAMACGMPVVAYGRGSVGEIIEDGVSGFIVDPSKGVGGFMRAIVRVNNMNKGKYKKMRQEARKRVEEHFSSEKMVEGYERVYEKVLSGKRRAESGK